MRPAWRLSIRNLSERRSRTALLVATVALSAALIAAVTCAMASAHKAIRRRIDATVGAADLRIAHVGKRPFDQQILHVAESWPEVALAVGRGQDAIPLRNPRTGQEVPTIGYGLMLDREFKLRPHSLREGRTIEREGEIALDPHSASQLEAQIGDRLEVVRFGTPVTLEVVGIVDQAAVGGIARAESFVTLEQLAEIQDVRGKLREVDIVLKPGADPQAVAEAHAAEMPRGLVLSPTAKITSGLDKNLQGSQIGMVIAATLSFLAAAFIIMTGLTTDMTERQRELAILRCIGGTRAQLAEAQVVAGGVVGILGAMVGVPLGVGGAWVLVSLLRDQLPAGFAVSWLGVALAVGGAVLSGIIGASWPAVRAMRTSPLEAMRVRARHPRPRGIVLCLVFGLLGAAIHIAIISLLRDRTLVFWGDIVVGVPSMFAGYFLLAVPATLAVVALVGPLIGRALRLPGNLLGRTVLATPYRHGFTAAAMMVGLALLIAIWTNGRSVLRDWLQSLTFPDAFVYGRSMSEQTQERIEQIPGVRGTVAITLQSLAPENVFGIPGLSRYQTTFIAFEPEPFFRMTTLKWEEGDPKTALEKLQRGGAVLVAKEFKLTRGMGVGDTIDLEYQGQNYQFEIVGVVNSPGLDIVNKFFDIGEEYLQQAVSAVFGSRRDLIEKFGNDAVNLIQIDIDPAADDEAVVKAARRIPGVITAGSGREIKGEITTFLGATLLIFSVVAVGAMLVACFGVANLIVAGIQQRQFEFGVLRAIGAQRETVARLVLGEAIIIAIVACLLGTIMGVQGSWAGQRQYQNLLGLDLTLKLPWGAIAAGWVILAAITLAAAWPAIWRLAQREPRELLGAMKG
jgi:putative ABC transport system permease protein